VPQRIPERLSPITPQLAWRVAVLGGMAFVLFGIVFFRLWFLQVLSGQEYVSQARENRVRKIPIEAARGDIVDRNDETLVQSKIAAVVQMLPNQLPVSIRTEADGYRKALAAAQGAMLKKRAEYDAYAKQLKDDGVKDTKAQKRDLRQLKKEGQTATKVPIPPAPLPDSPLGLVYRRLSRVLRSVSPHEIHARVIRGIADAPYSNVTIQTDVDTAEFNYIKENQENYPGVVVTTQYLRDYPHNDLAAQLFGTTGQVSQAQTLKGSYKGVPQGTRVGQSGLERQYDKYLRGRNGYTRVVVNAFGARDDQAKTTEKPAVQGERLKLTLDQGLQKAGDDALARGIAASGHGATAGAYVAMDPDTGAILAMGSKPGFDANVFAKPFSQKVWSFLTSDSTSAPLLDRAFESGYPTGSVFKPVTALAALQAHAISPTQKVDDTGTYEYGNKTYHNAKDAHFGSIDMSDALKVSSDIYFFKLGAALNNNKPYIQQMARKLGFGRSTGLDVPGEIPGLVPDAAWRNNGYAKYRACADKYHLNYGTQAALFKCGGIEREWLGGDNVNLAVGQGDLLATPLQVAVAYSALENGGTIVKPHLGSAIEDGYGRTIQEIHKRARRKVKLNPSDRAVVLDGLHRAASEQGGTSADVFKGWDQKSYPVYGKTGTAERGNQADQAWYACFVKTKSRPIVVVVTIEKGGFGAETAAPVARLILSQWFSTGDNVFHAGSSTTL
jgi:penicillin-binding protein 2